MKVQTFIVGAVLLALCAATVSAQFGYSTYFDRLDFDSNGYFVDVRFDFGTYLNEFLPIGNYFGEDYLQGSDVLSGIYRYFNFDQYENYFNIDTIPILNGYVVPFDAQLRPDKYEYLLGGIGNGYIFSSGEGIGIVFPEGSNGPDAIGFFLDAADHVLNQQFAASFTIEDYGRTIETYSGDTHTQFFGVINGNGLPVNDIGFFWGDYESGPIDVEFDGDFTDGVVVVNTRNAEEAEGIYGNLVGPGFYENYLNEEFYEDKAYLVAEDPLLAGLNHVLLPASYVGNLFGERPSTRDVDTIVNAFDHESMSVNMVMSGDNEFTTAAFSLASGAQILIETAAEGNFVVTIDGSELSLGDIVAEYDFTVYYSLFENLPRTTIANGQSWFEKNIENEEHTAVVRVANADLVVDVSLSLKDGDSVLNVNMRELNQKPTSTGLLRAADAMSRVAAKNSRSLTSDHMEFLISATTVDSLF